jgi:hypothetical protein
MLLFGGFALLFAVFAAILLLVLPGDRTPFDYMVAGSFASGLALVFVLVFLLRRR